MQYYNIPRNSKVHSFGEHGFDRLSSSLLLSVSLRVEACEGAGTQTSRTRPISH